MSVNTLFLAWQDRAETRFWFPVGRLDADIDRRLYRFRYTFGAKRAQEKAGFYPLLEFPDLNGDYRSARLFALFQNRVINPSRPDREDYLRGLGLAGTANPLEILSVNGGKRVTDTYEVFPKLVKDATGRFKCRFLLHGWRYVNKQARERIEQLKQNEELHVTLELNNPVSGIALQIQTWDYFMIGWTPRYLVDDLARAIAESRSGYEARVVSINRMPSPYIQQIVIEFRGRWEEHDPMTGKDFKLLNTTVKNH